MKKITLLLSLFLTSLLWTSCERAGGADSFTAPQNFRDYWYNGQAEISRYTLDQVQYGAQNPGEAVLIFVTEDFRTDTQVKLESDAKDKATSVLKLNSTRRFVTGIYDYSIFSSVFSPINTKKYEHSLKVTMSSQDWCGQVYSQLNLSGNKYDVMVRSYFEKNATEDFKIDAAWLEDEVWTRLRMNPEALPQGETSVIPAAYAVRIVGQKMEPQKAVGALTGYAGNAFTGKALQQYSLKVSGSQAGTQDCLREGVPIRNRGLGRNLPLAGKELTTRATKTQQTRSDYWSHNAPGDTTLRNQLGVEGF